MDKADIVKVIGYYEEKAYEAAQAREAYRVAWAQAFLASEAKNDTARKADADIKTADLRVKRDRTAIHAQVTKYEMLADVPHLAGADDQAAA